MPTKLLTVAAILGAAALLAAGCGRKPDAAPAPPITASPSPTAPPAPPAEPAPARAAVAAAPTDSSALLGELTQAVRRYGMEKQRVPASLAEVVSAGYIKLLPPAPAGKKFAIDAKRMEVVLVRE